ncbi:MAG: M23 family metallopeptidase [Chloroflexi bacterium]|nr:M23 family metallopeptidase [Chloroflexota bacterium]
MNTLRRIAFAVGLLIIAIGLPDSSLADHNNNRWEFYRWPWAKDVAWKMSQGWNGATSHTSASGLFYAIDVRYDPSPTQLVYAASDGYATCTTDDPSFGNFVRITHGSTSSLYAHLVTCNGFTGTNVPQGFQIGTAGCTGRCDGIHVHFQKNTNTTGTTSAPFTMNSHTGWDNGGADCPVGGCLTCTSDNRSAGYSEANPIVYDDPIRQKYWSAGKWDVVGSTASISSWTPGRSPATTCGSSATPGWYPCNFTDVNGASRAGRVQTFKGTGSGNGEHAVFKDSSSSFAVFMSRGLLGPYTDPWATGKDGMYYLGYPLNDGGSIGGTIWQMSFENGYANYDWSNCASRWYYWSAFLSLYIEVGLTDYCD